MKERIFSLFLAICMIISLMTGLELTASAATSGTYGDNLTWSLDDEGTLTISGSGEPSSGVPWKSQSKNIINVIIENGLTIIERGAFEYCSNITSVTIPNSVTSIGERAFHGCSSLTSLTISKGVTSIENSAFSSCSSLTSVTIPDSVISIDMYAFSECSSLTSVTIPEGVTSIGYESFSNCSSLTSVTISNSVISIGDNAFSNCDRLTNITVDNDNENYSSLDGNLFDKNQTTLLLYAIGKQDTHYTIPSSVTSIENSAFSSCSSLTSVTIPDSVISIGMYAFCKCSNLTGVTIPDSVTSIGRSAFYECSSLTNVTISNCITNIYDLFAECSSLINVTIPKSVTAIGYCSFMGCSSLTSVTIPDSVTSIDDFAFCKCSSLTNVTIPDSVTSIGERAFSSCSSLTDVYYSGSEEQWRNIEISAENDCLKNATIHYDHNISNEIKVMFNGEQIEFDVSPMTINDRTMVPMRAIFEALGADVEWDASTQTAIGKTEAIDIKITIGEKYLLKNDTKIELDSPAIVISDRTLVPVRAISESLDCKVEWDGETKTVLVTK